MPAPHQTKSLPAVALALASLAGCATQPRSDLAASRVDVDSHVLLGQIALEAQHLEEAAQHYLDAALVSTDPELAERATRMAHRLVLNDIGHRAVARWRELAPEDERADYFAAIFEFRSGRLDRAVDDFASVLGSLDEADIGSGIALVLDALTSEPAALAATRVMAALVERFPGTPEGHFGLARLAMRSGDFDLALEHAEAAVGLVPDWLDAELLYARALLVSGRTDESLALASRLAEETDDAQVRLQYAELLLSAGESDSARALLDDILADNPGLPEAIRALAFLELTSDDLDAATEHFETLRGDPAYRDEAFYYLGRIAEERGDYLGATRAYARVVEGTHAVEAQQRTSQIMLEEMHDPEGALRHLREFGNANPLFSSNMLLAQVRILLQMDEPERAIALFDDAVDASGVVDPGLRSAHVQFYTLLTQDAVDRGDLEAAEAWITEGLDRYPGDTSLRYSLALLLQEQGRLRRAVNVLESLVEDEPDNPTLLNALGYLLTDKFDRNVEARGYIQRALAMMPDNAAIIDSMGWVLFRLGEYEAALDYLERAHRLMDDPEVVAHLVDVHWALGQRELALEMLNEALREQPDDPHLTEVSQRLGR